jgi:carboxymethylenebutenolidase
MIERQVDIKTKDGVIGTFVCRPERGGPHPVVIIYMDAPGIREELRDMARRLGTVGYYVLLPNLYYRWQRDEFPPFIGKTDPDSLAIRKRMDLLLGGLTINHVMDDTPFLLDFADADSAASKGPVGCVGYCMSGQFAVNAARRFSTRVHVAASFYGAFLVTETPDSPHLAITSTDARLYFGCAETDHCAPREVIDRLQMEASKPHTNTEVEIYLDAKHGFAFPQRSAFDKTSAERHWERLLTMFDSELWCHK